MEGYWRVHLVDISTYINLYVPIWSLTHLYLIFISDLKPLLLGDVDKKKKREKVIYMIGPEPQICQKFYVFTI